EIEPQPAASAVSQRVQPLQRADALLEDAVSSLSLDVVGGVAGRAPAPGPAVRGEKARELLLTRLEENRQVAPIDHAATQTTRLGDEVSEIRIQLRCATRYVHGRHRRAGGQQVQHARSAALVHALGTLRSRLY